MLRHRSRTGRVLAIEDNKITYESRGKKAVQPGKIWGPKVTVPADQFAVLIEKEVREDYDPNYEQSNK